MSSLALNRNSGSLSGLGSPPAGDFGLSILQRSVKAVDELKAGILAGTSWVFNDLHALAQEHEMEVRDCEVFILAQRLLLALPGSMPPPELSLDEDGEVSFDWHGPGGRFMTMTLREDGRLSYAARMSAFDKDHGTKRFVDAIPKNILELVHRTTDS
jgi:hypothetical protein